MISRQTIEEVKSRVDILDVIGDFVTLKKAGNKYYRALSPFTDEKTPSFYVTPSMGIFKCFSTGKSGDAFSFLMEHDGMTYPEAIRFLAQRYGVEIIDEGQNDEVQEAQKDRESLYIVLGFANEHFNKILHGNEEGKGIGLSYFKERGFSSNSIKNFELGYSLDSWDGLITAATAAGYSEDLLEKAGLIQVKENKKYDRFRGRVMFPIHNLSGKVIGFGARTLSKDKKQPKYLNSPESEVYHKSEVLYGLFQAKNAIRNADECLLVEGYTDVIALSQAGVDHVVSSSGTALTKEQIRLIKRFSDNITVIFDGDQAGIKASLRGIDMILEEGLNVRVVPLPDGEDPDSFSKARPVEEFTAYLNSAKEDFIRFKAGLLIGEAGDDPIRRAGVIRDIVESISLIGDPVQRSVYIRETSKLMEMDETVIIAELNKILIRKKRDRRGKQQDAEITEPLQDFQDELVDTHVSPGQLISYQEKETIRILINYGHLKSDDGELLAKFIFNELEDLVFNDPLYLKIAEDFKSRMESDQPVDIDYFLNHKDGDIKKTVIDLVTEKYEVSAGWHDMFDIFVPKEEDILNVSVKTNLLRLKYRVVRKMLQDNLEKIRKSGPDDDIDEVMEAHQELKDLEVKLADSLGIVIGG